MRRFVFIVLLSSSLLTNRTYAQTGSLFGKVVSEHLPVASATIEIRRTDKKAIADSLGNFSITNLPYGSYTLLISSVGFYNSEYKFVIKEDNATNIEVSLTPDNTALSNVVVTGVSKATLIKENPVAISLISAKQLAQTIESNLIDALSRNVNGLNVVKTGPNVSKPFIRGLGYNRVLTLFDGMRQEGQQWGDEHGIEADAYHIAKAEVIKGPASLQYGSDAIAGVVSLFSFVPKYTGNKIEGSFVTEYQSNNNLLGNGLRISYSNQKVLISASGSLRMGGNYRNSVDGRVYNTGFSEKNLSLFTGLKSENGYSHLTITLYDNLQGIPDGSRDSISRRFTKQIFEGEKDDIKMRPFVSEKELNSYNLSPLHQHIQHYRVYSHHAYQIGRNEVDVLVGVQQNIRREYNHPTTPNQAGMYIRLNTMNYNIRYNMSNLKRVELSVGVNGMLQSNKSLDATDFPIPDYCLFDIGTYLYGKWKKNKWTISGGIRNDVRSVIWHNFYTKTNTITGFGYQATVADTVNAQLQFPAYQKIFNGISASLGVTYSASDHISLKANIGRGYRAPSITEMASNGLDPGAHIIYLGNRNFKPEFSLQQDAGISVEYKNISAEASVFSNTIQKYIYLTLLADDNGNAVTDAQGNRSFQYQQASAQLYGAEAWLSFHPGSVKGLRFDNSVNVVYGFNTKKDYKNKGVEGEYLPLIPPLRFTSCFSKRTELSSDIVNSITVKIESVFDAKQNRFLGLNNTETATPSYLLINTGLTSEIKYARDKIWQIVFQVNNIANAVYQSHLSRLKYFESYSYSYNGRSGIYSMGRNICIKMIFPF